MPQSQTTVGNHSHFDRLFLNRDWYCEELDTFDFANGASGWVAPANSGYAAYYSSSQKALLLSHTSSQTRPTWTSPSFQSTNGQAQIIYDYKTEDHESYANDRFSLECKLRHGQTWVLIGLNSNTCIVVFILYQIHSIMAARG